MVLGPHGGSAWHLRGKFDPRGFAGAPTPEEMLHLAAIVSTALVMGGARQPLSTRASTVTMIGDFFSGLVPSSSQPEVTVQDPSAAIVAAGKGMPLLGPVFNGASRGSISRSLSSPLPRCCAGAHPEADGSSSAQLRPTSRPS